ncbi:hypothetical protein B4U80_14953 [Leptotrombidium deliense]|uniref:NTR domain-containing protein n=1 Tax=Leptotrombidium deliense TaxID=299467 RepID=A0A443RXQ4_9ACAR|nr:hypothetical protein B4U80_14953 [Leptotrombidium deliense]
MNSVLLSLSLLFTLYYCLKCCPCIKKTQEEKFCDADTVLLIKINWVKENRNNDTVEYTVHVKEVFSGSANNAIIRVKAPMSERRCGIIFRLGSIHAIEVVKERTFFFTNNCLFHEDWTNATNYIKTRISNILPHKLCKKIKRPKQNN